MYSVPVHSVWTGRRVMQAHRVTTSREMVEAFLTQLACYGASKTFPERRRRFVQCQRAFNQLMLSGLRSGMVASLIEPSTVRSTPRAIQPAQRLRSESTSQSLTTQQMVVARLIADGLSNRQIAERLTIAPGTVANHVRHIMVRLGVDNRVQIAVWTLAQSAAG
jgi:DNA-binding NarL/FixJ family response regulator